MEDERAEELVAMEEMTNELRASENEGYDNFQTILLMRYGVSSPHLLTSATINDLRVIHPSIASFYNLKKLLMGGGHIERIEHLESLSKLKELNLSNNHILSVKNLDQNVNLEVLNLDNNFISSIKFKHLRYLKNLKALSLKGSKIKNLRSTIDIISKALPQLEELHFQEMQPIDEQTQNMIQDWGEDEESSSSDEDEGGAEGLRTIQQAILNLTQQVQNFVHALDGILENQTVQNNSPNSIQLLPNHDNQVPPLQPEDFVHIEREDEEMNDDTSSPSNESIEMQEFYDHGFVDLEDEQNELVEEEEENHIDYNCLHVSPICKEKAYREYAIFKLKNLKVLDGVQVSELEREKCKEKVMKVFEFIPFEEMTPINAVKLLGDWRKGRNLGNFKRKVEVSLYNSVGSTVFEKDGRESSINVANYPLVKQLAKEGRKRARYSNSDLRNVTNLISGRNNNVLDHTDDIIHLLPSNNSPRQFEYSSGVPHWMVYGTNSGLLVLHNHVNDVTLGAFQMRERSNIFGLHWLKNNPTKFVSGNDSGDIYLVDGEKMVRDEQPIVAEYERFSRLSSVTVNSSDTILLSSGARKVAVFDVETARTIACHKDLHLDNINVLKFSNTNPNIFATSSFDTRMKVWDIRTNLSRPIYTRKAESGMVMLTWSPDDRFILTSGSDNEVRQYEAPTGRLDIKYAVPKKNQEHNYTRSYYTNNGDYMITGSCEESVVRMYSTKTGKLLREVELRRKDVIESSCYIQSLRGDPNRDFSFTALLSFKPSVGKESQLLNINLLQPSDHEESV